MSQSALPSEPLPGEQKGPPQLVLAGVSAVTQWWQVSRFHLALQLRLAVRVIGCVCLVFTDSCPSTSDFSPGAEDEQNHQA